MIIYKAEEVRNYSIIEENSNINYIPYPYLRSSVGDKEMYSISPNHGRSYLIRQKEDGRFVISKGNGLSYTQYNFLNTREFNIHTFGLLLRKDALRDFRIGMEIADLGIKTNIMECVIEIDKELLLSDNKTIIKPYLLQYNVESPYRICDYQFVPKKEIEKDILKWENYNSKSFREKYLIAADVLINNLRILHSNNIIYNAFNFHNTTWALELLDFEISTTPKNSYSEEDKDNYHVELKPREILQVYELINQIAWLLGERIDYKLIDSLFLDHGFDISIFDIDKGRNQKIL